MNKILGALIIIIFLAIAGVVSLLAGPYQGIGISDIARYLAGDREGLEAGIIKYRIVRTLAAAIAGAALAGSGITIQYILRNPLADPYLLGISSGAALGVLLVIYKSQAPPAYGIYAAAFTAGLTGFGAVVILSTLLGLSSTALIVAGVSISYLLGGASMILIVKLGDKLPGAAAWLFGTVAYVTPTYLLYTAIVALVSLTGILAISRIIGTLILGEEMSRGLGVSVNKLRIAASALAALAASSIVAMAGPIGFIGLAGPWLARLLVGSWFPHAYLASLAAGAFLAIVSDVTVRGIGGGEIPLTAISSLYGGAVLFYLTARSGRELQ